MWQWFSHETFIFLLSESTWSYWWSFSLMHVLIIDEKQLRSRPLHFVRWRWTGKTTDRNTIVISVTYPTYVYHQLELILHKWALPKLALKFSIVFYVHKTLYYDWSHQFEVFNNICALVNVEVQQQLVSIPTIALTQRFTECWLIVVCVRAPGWCRECLHSEVRCATTPTNTRVLLSVVDNRTTLTDDSRCARYLVSCMAGYCQ